MCPTIFLSKPLSLFPPSLLFPLPPLPPTEREPVADLTKACYDKVALLVGNKKYRIKQLQLNTPENDTQDLTGILLSAGFKVVSLVNLTKEEMERVSLGRGIFPVI